MANRDKPYQVGYGKPPKQHQFTKGKSGNPTGRPKGSKKISEIVEQVCRAEVTVKGEDGNKFKMPKMQAVMLQLMNKALQGDLKATQTCFRILKMFPHVIEPPPPPVTKRVIVFRTVEDVAEETRRAEAAKQPKIP